MSFVGGKVGITVTGLNEILRSNAAMLSEISQTRMQVHRESATFLANDWKAHVHTISGRTKSSIKVESVNQQQGVVSGGFGAPFEERREGSKPPPHVGSGTGPHASGREALARTGQQMGAIAKKYIDALLARHKTR